MYHNILNDLNRTAGEKPDNLNALEDGALCLLAR